LSRPGLFVRARVICQGEGYLLGRGLFVKARVIYLRSGSEVVLGYSRARGEKGRYIYIYI
jgi:hypothetical protein